MKITTIIMAAAMLSPASFASSILQNCKFDTLPGRSVQILPLTPSEKFLMRDHGYKYPFIITDRFSPENATEIEFYNRQGKLESDRFYRRIEGFGNDKKAVRYHSLITDNCQQLWISIDEAILCFQNTLTMRTT